MRTIRTHFKKSLIAAICFFLFSYLYCNDCIPSQIDTSRDGWLGAVITTTLANVTHQVAIPIAPAGVSATPGDGSVTISWIAVADATSYNIYWGTAPGVTRASGTKISSANSPYLHSGLTNGTAYYYIVTAVNSAGESPPSAETGTTPQVGIPGAPAGVNAVAGSAAVTVSWSPVTGATSYNIYWGTAPGVTTATGTQITGAASPYTHTGRTNGTAYYYIVTAMNGVLESAASAEVNATPQLPPAVMAGNGGTIYYTLDGTTWSPKVITATNVTFTSIVSTGTHYVAAGGPPGGCEIYRSDDGVNWTSVKPAACNDTINDLVYANGTIVGVGGSTTFAGQPIVVSSVNNGATWSMAGLGSAFPGLSEIVYDGANFMAMGLDASSVPVVFRSTTASGFTMAPFPGGRYPLNNVKSPCALGHAFHVPSATAPTTRTIVAGVDCSSLTFPVASSYSDNSASTAWTYDATAIFAGNTIPEIPRGMAYSGTRLVAVGDNCRAAFSNDSTGALNWTSGTMSGCLSGERWDDVAYDASGAGRYIAVGRVGIAGVIAISPTGVLTDWTVSGIGTAAPNAIAVRSAPVQPAPLALAVAAGNGGTVYYTLDGATWISKTIAAANVTFNSIVSTGTHYVAAGGSPAGCEIYRSADGLNWTSVKPAGCNDTINDLVFANATIVGVGGITTFTNRPIVITSMDSGATWTVNPGTAAAAPAFDEIVWDGTYYEAMGVSAGNPTLYRNTTPSGLTAAPFPNPLTPFFKNACLLGNVYSIPGTPRTVVAGTSCGVLAPTPALSTFSNVAGTTAWTSNATAVFGGNTAGEIPRGMAYNGTRLVAVGDNCRGDFSDNPTGALTWTNGTVTGCATGVGERRDDVIFFALGAKFIAVGRTGIAVPAGVMAVSPTGALVDWTITATGTPPLNAIAER